MRDSLRLGRIAGIPIAVNWSVLGVVAFVVWTLTFQILPGLYPDSSLVARSVAGLGSAVLFFASILGHEMGHAIVARRHDVSTAGITLWLLGGVAKLTRQAPTPRAEFQIAAAGPAASLACSVLFLGGAAATGWLTDYQLVPAVLFWLGAVNLLLAVSNLLPAAPLDGGRVLTAWLWKRLGAPEPARLRSARVGIVLGLVLIVVGAVALLWFRTVNLTWISTLVMGLFLASAARSEVAGATIRNRLSTTNVGGLMVPHPPSVPDDWTIDQLVAWAGPDGRDVAVPVTHWQQPVGLVVPRFADQIEPAAQSWTLVRDVMIPNDDIARAWATKTVDAALDRIGLEQFGTLTGQQALVVHDPRSGAWLGTVTEAQTLPLFDRGRTWTARTWGSG